MSLDRGQTNKIVELNFGPVSILNEFSKIYEKNLKNLLISHLDETLSLFIAAHKKGYGTQHVLTKMIEEFMVKLNNDNIVGATLVDLLEASIAFHKIYSQPNDMPMAQMKMP